MNPFKRSKPWPSGHGAVTTIRPERHDMSHLSPLAVEKALRHVISDLDYDTHKSIERDEETGEDHYPALAAMFSKAYEAAEATS